MKRISIILVALLLGLAAPTLATAQLGPQNVPPSLTQTDDPDSTAFEQDTGLSTRQLVLIFGGAFAIIAFIAWFIMRDAHRAAPASERGRVGESSGAGTARSSNAKSAREREREKARKRNKAKAARNQRKRNRPH
ncbi:MAG TPA: hypothetical protein VGO80_21915 [Solirubrobacteraceae bacterium]|nr:hypothetical protein [Solirubrobacteraceae bacterium]